jgi:hypothetical protein
VILTKSFGNVRQLNLFWGKKFKDDFRKETLSIWREELTGVSRNIFKECEVGLEAEGQQVEFVN